MAVTTPELTRVATRVGVRPAQIRTTRSGTALVVALVAVCAYAVFAHGAAGLPEEPRLQIGIAFVAIGAAVGWLLTRSLAVRAPAEVWIGVGLLLGFAVWCAITLLWSVAPDRTWAHINRAVAYTLIVVLAIAVGSTTPRAIEKLAYGWLLVALACALYAMCGKVIPGVEILGIDFNHTQFASRLREPLQYWNALSLVCVLASPIALRIATDDGRRPGVRVGGMVALYVLVICIGMTYSRGGILALLVLLTVVTILGGARLRGLAVFWTTVVLTIPVLGLAFSRPTLKDIRVPLDGRIPDGIILGLVMAGSIVALVMAAWGLLRLEERTPWDGERTRLVWRGLGAIAATCALLALTTIVTAEGGPSGAFDSAWEKFTQTSKDNVSDPARIVSSNSGNRWVWWKEAAGAWSDKPIGGWGAGSFPVTDKLYRKIELSPEQPHNMPLQFLAETGIVGALLAYGGLGFLLFAALERIRSMAAGRERDIAVALFGGAVAWLAHGLVDWDWDIPGVTVPVLLFLGVLVARGRPPVPVAAPPESGVGGRATLLAVACVLLGLVVVSAWMPLLADSKASSALAISTDAGEAELVDAAAEAEVGIRLDPTSVRSQLAAASIAQNRGRLLEARDHLLAAAERQPSNAVIWERLLRLTLATADRRAAKVAAKRLLELDPIGSPPRAVAAQAALFVTPAAGSPTATGTPLSPRYAAPALTPTPLPGPAAGTPPAVTPPAVTTPGAVAPPPPGAD